jgi:DNA-directed RNA polymerase specialized sigma subunit
MKGEMMLFVEYERCKDIYIELQAKYESVMLEKERLFTRVMPNAINYDKEDIQTSISSNMLDEYILALERNKVDERLESIKSMLADRQRLLTMKEQALRKSPDKNDRIYVMRYLDGMSVRQMTRRMHLSKTQIYRILDEIRQKI